MCCRLPDPATTNIPSVRNSKMRLRRPLLQLALALLAIPVIAEEGAPLSDVSVIQTVSQTDVTAQQRLAQQYRSEEPLESYKKGFLQTASVSTGWLSGLSGSRLNSNFVELSLKTAVPLGSFEHIMGVSPSFRTDYIDAAPGVDAPSELHQAGVSFVIPHKINPRWSALAIVAPSVRGDFTTSDDALRIFGMALLTWQAKPDRLAVSFGVVYPDRADLPILPALGLKWTPNRHSIYDIRFPESRFSWRLAKDGCHSETWAYMSGGFGGSTWAVTRADGSHDQLSLKDIRVMLGVERKFNGGGRLFAESGLAFSRSLEYEETQFEQDFGNAVVIQAGLAY